MSRSLIQISRLFKSFNSRSLFEDISLSVNEGDVFAFIGENGAGKTTLLQILAGQIPPDRSRVLLSPNLTIGFLPQEVAIPNIEASVKQYVESGELSQLEKQMELCLSNPHELAKWEKLHEEYESRGGYKRLPLEKVLKGLKLEIVLDAPMVSLSSGQKVRVALAKALIDNPDVLLLDEPTNHLDEDMLNWLEETLRNRKGATVIVSHDRKFLNKTCNRLIEIRKGKLACYGGNYDFYLKEQKRILESQIKAYETEEEKRAEIKRKLRDMTFSKAKKTPPKDRNIMAYDKRGESLQKSMERKANELKEKLQEIEDNLLVHPKPKSITGLRFVHTPLASKVAIELDHISKSFDEKILFSSLSKQVCKGDRIVIVGENGSGKTTLLRCIAGLLPINNGSVRFAPTAKIAYLDQEIEMLPMEQTPLEYFENQFSLSEEQLRREFHKATLESADLLKRPFRTLSVGQRKRLMLLSLILQKPNVLILDEPTNHLDLLTLEALEKALLDFEGAILAVSHDQTFIDKIATETWKL